MNKSQLVAIVAEQTGLPAKAVSDVLEAQGQVIAEFLVDTHTEVILPGLGKLKIATRAARAGRNPQTGAEVQIPSRKAVKFLACKGLRDRLNP